MGSITVLLACSIGPGFLSAVSTAHPAADGPFCRYVAARRGSRVGLKAQLVYHAPPWGSWRSAVGALAGRVGLAVVVGVRVLL